MTLVAGYVYRGSDFTVEDYSQDFAGLGRGGDPRCGTRAGWDAHPREGTERCEACLRAHALYMQSYRLLHPGLDRRRRPH